MLNGMDRSVPVPCLFCACSVSVLCPFRACFVLVPCLFCACSVSVLYIYTDCFNFPVSFSSTYVLMYDSSFCQCVFCMQASCSVWDECMCVCVASVAGACVVSVTCMFSVRVL